MALIDGIVSYWKLDEVSGLNADDAHGANDGTLNNMEDPGDWVAGKINNALSFGGTDEFVNVGTMGNLGTNMDAGISLSFWIKTTTTTASKVFGEASAAGTTLYWVVVNASSTGATDPGKIQFVIRDEDNKTMSGGTTADTTFNNGNWHHIVVTMDGPGDTGVIYFDGSSVGVTHVNQQTPANFDNFDYDVYFGAANLRGAIYHPLVGVLDELGVWNKILNSDEVTELWNGGAGLQYPFVAVGTNMKINISDVFKDIESLKINIGNVWKDVVQVQQNIGDVWKTVFG